ncbi:MAG TPA: 3-oxoacyl-ACP reductase FabG, partial [Accumulibacter sp.]|nr:3-oxoacyl-ACP reductase FabG [Accumulibacter sp.]
ATTAEGAAKISAYLSAAGCSGEGAVLEVRESEQIDELIGSIERAHGAVTVLVNNAGITRDNLTMRMKDDEWDLVLDTDLKAVFRLSKAVMRGMIKARRGRIINVTSVVGHAGNPGQANYCAAKAGVAGLSRSLARELASRNITVNCVAPGLIDTDMTQALDDKQKAAMLAAVPLGRLGTPSDIAAAVAFLASPTAAYITGTTLHVNGGMFMG